MNLRRRYQILYILNRVESFRKNPSFLAAWLQARPNYGKTPPKYPPENTLWWILRLGGYISTIESPGETE